MAFFIIVDKLGVIHGCAQAISAQFITGNVKEGQKVVEVDRLYADAHNYVFNWETMDIDAKPESGEGFVLDN